ncbi:HNH endonuclease [Sarocladium implicatum]|nr:HNH endonuclease [Sarocladium implicatum]
MSDNGSDSTADEDQDNPNFALFRDCLSATLLKPAPDSAPAASAPKQRRVRRRAKSSAQDGAKLAKSATPSNVGTGPGFAVDQQGDADELADFIDYLSSEIFDSLPHGLRELDHRSWRDDEALQAEYTLPLTTTSLASLNLPLDITDTLQTYSLISPDPTIDSPLPSCPEAFLIPILTPYIETLTTPPPASYMTRADACELCGRDWIPLSYHHLIPRFVHDKAVKRGWHKKEDLQNVAWLCGACHRFVHHWRSHEDLARDYYTVDLLLEEEEVRKFAAWAGKLRWKGGRSRSKR